MAGYVRKHDRKTLRRTSALKATAFHEAGHAVAAWRLGLKVTRASIIPDAPSETWGATHWSGPLRPPKPRSADPLRAGWPLDRTIVLHLAGPAAQRRHRPSSWRSHHGRGDADLVRELALLRNGGDEALSGAYLKWMTLNAERLVDENWSLIARMAGELMRRYAMTGREISNLLGRRSMSRAAASS